MRRKSPAPPKPLCTRTCRRPRRRRRLRGSAEKSSVTVLILLFPFSLTAHSGRGSIRRIFRSLPSSSTDHGPGANNSPFLRQDRYFTSCGRSSGYGVTTTTYSSISQTSAIFNFLVSAGAFLFSIHETARAAAWKNRPFAEANDRFCLSFNGSGPAGDRIRTAAR